MRRVSQDISANGAANTNKGQIMTEKGRSKATKRQLRSGNATIDENTEEAVEEGEITSQNMNDVAAATAQFQEDDNVIEMEVLLNIGYVSNETNTDVHMYTCRIYSSRDLDTLLHKVELELNMHWKNAGLYTLTTKD